MSVTIQCPNGRRQTMKVKPNTSILEILEYVCEKQNFDPKEYELSRNNKPLDLSLTIRFANIPNNGQLDLKKASVVRKDQKVTVAITLEDGMRETNEFDSNQSLWDVIYCLFENKPILNLEQNMQFSVIYIQKEIAGEKEMKETTLKSLGLIQGRAAMKLLVRPIDANREQAFIESIDLKKFNKQSEEKKSNQTSRQIESKAVPTTPESRSEPTVVSTQQTAIDSLKAKPNEAMELDLQNQKTVEPIVRKSDEIQKMEISSEESEDESEELGGNHSEILFKMSDLPKVSKKEYPDEFYNTTKDDLVHVLNDLRRQQTAESLKPLETKQMKEQRRKEQLNKYKSTVVRICFPNDKLVFQAIFKPTDSVEDVKRVVHNYISSEDFYLYTAPPKRILKAESSLFESDLVPAALIQFGLNSDNNKNVVKEEFKTKLSSYKSAAKVATNARNEGKTALSNPSGQTPTPSSENRTPGENRRPGSGESGAKVPKWFKTN